MNWLRVTGLVATTVFACASERDSAISESDASQGGLPNEPELVPCTPLERRDGGKAVLSRVMGAGAAVDGRYYVVARKEGASSGVYRPDLLYIGDAEGVTAHQIGGSTVGGTHAAGTFALSFVDGATSLRLLGEWRQGVVVAMWLSENPATTPTTRSGDEEMLELLAQEDAEALPAFGAPEVHNVRFDAIDASGDRAVVLQHSGDVTERSYRVFTSGDQGSLDERVIASQLFDSAHTLEFVENGAERVIRYGTRASEIDGVTVAQEPSASFDDVLFRCIRE